MRYGLYLPNFGYCGDARLLADLARDAEAASWDGFFLWDHVRFPHMEPHADPWVAFAAIAMQSERLRFGPMVTPVPRRRPWKLARETVTLDHLSQGRLTFGAGSGILPEEFGPFGEAADPKTRAAMLDEGLELLTALWSGEPVTHHGRYYRVETVAFAPPLQRPRPPIWIAGTWPFKAPFRRAARWDGVFPQHKDFESGALLAPTDIREIIAYVGEHRTSSDPFDVVASGLTQGGGQQADVDAVAPFAEAGATWWLELCFPWAIPVEELRARIRNGPPRVQ
jgi:alkanesulfonate monooxygenase SsuD/methylene tetrahydromethanopterin reductase-like flavin-dependent oxidoreductase (luciferase family)